MHKSLLGSLVLIFAFYVLPLRPVESYPGSESECSTMMGYLGRDGKFLISPILKEAYPFSDGVGWVRTESDVEARPARFSVINRSGQILFSTTRKADDFHCGLARIHQGALTGFIDKTGTVVIPIQYASAEDFKANKSRVVTPDWKSFIINTAGEHFALEYTGRGLAGEKQIQPFGTVAVDASGRHMFKPSEAILDHQRFGHYSEGLCHVTLDSPNAEDHREAFMNESGEIVLTLSPAIEACSDFHDGMASIVIQHQDDEYHRTGGCVGFINREGKVVIPAIYELPHVWQHYNPVEIVAFHEDRVRARKMGIDFYLDKSGNPIAQFQGGVCSDFTEGLAPIAVLLDGQGKEIDFSDKSHGYQNRFDYESALCKILSERLQNIQLDKPVTIRFHEVGIGPSAPNITADDSVPVTTLSEIRAIVKTTELPTQGIFLSKFVYFDVTLQNGSVTCAPFHSHYHR